MGMSLINWSLIRKKRGLTKGAFLVTLCSFACTTHSLSTAPFCSLTPFTSLYTHFAHFWYILLRAINSIPPHFFHILSPFCPPFARPQFCFRPILIWYPSHPGITLRFLLLNFFRFFLSSWKKKFIASQKKKKNFSRKKKKKKKKKS